MKFSFVVIVPLVRVLPGTHAGIDIEGSSAGCIVQGLENEGSRECKV